VTTATTTRSIYPPAVEQLLPQARTLAESIGTLPSRNRLMSELKIGAPKATALREALQNETPEPVHLHLVPDPEPTEADPEPTEPAASNEPVSADTDEPSPAQPTAVGHPEPKQPRRPLRSWPVIVLALPAFVAIWSGWVGIGGLTGFGIVHPLPGIWDTLALNTAITLPIGVETYAAFALRVWMSGRVPAKARQFAKCSAIGSLLLGGAGQVAYHLMAASGMTTAPWWITTLVACLPVAVLGMGAALAHLLHTDNQ